MTDRIPPVRRLETFHAADRKRGMDLDELRHTISSVHSSPLRLRVTRLEVALAAARSVAESIGAQGEEIVKIADRVLATDSEGAAESGFSPTVKVRATMGGRLQTLVIEHR